jgi:ubiquinone/menaquinone biosynthesis C-methylase UbiE
MPEATMMMIDERIKLHYELEKKLAQRILESSPETRARVTTEAYNELFSNIPWHSQLHNIEERKQVELSLKRMFFEYLLEPDSDILDIGAGTAYWTRYSADKTTGRCVGIDVSKEVLVRKLDDPQNLELYVMDAVELDFQASSFDIAFSSQLIEHLHPDDVEPHFARVHGVLKENGIYAFDTPSKLNGPHDISKYFDKVATGFHLKEWTYRELVNSLTKVGFKKIYAMILPWNLVNRLPFLRPLGMVNANILIPGEKLAETIEHRQIREALCKLFRIASIYVVAHK